MNELIKEPDEENNYGEWNGVLQEWVLDTRERTEKDEE